MMQECLDSQSRHLKEIEHNFVNVLESKFDVLISAGRRLQQNMTRLVALAEKTLSKKNALETNPKDKIDQGCLPIISPPNKVSLKSLVKIDETRLIGRPILTQKRLLTILDQPEAD